MAVSSALAISASDPGGRAPRGRPARVRRPGVRRRRGRLGRDPVASGRPGPARRPSRARSCGQPSRRPWRRFAPRAVKVGRLHDASRPCRAVARALPTLSVPSSRRAGLRPPLGRPAPSVDGPRGARPRPPSPAPPSSTLNLLEASVLAGLRHPATRPTRRLPPAASRPSVPPPSSSPAAAPRGRPSSTASSTAAPGTASRVRGRGPSCRRRRRAPLGRRHRIPRGDETLPDAVGRAIAFVRHALAAGWPAAPLHA